MLEEDGVGLLGLCGISLVLLLKLAEYLGSRLKVPMFLRTIHNDKPTIQYDDKVAEDVLLNRSESQQRGRNSVEIKKHTKTK